VRESHNEPLRNASPIRQSTAGETDKKRSQSTEENSTKVNHDSKIHENPTGCAEDCSYPAISIANVPIHLKSASAENSEKCYANALATENEQTCVEVSSDQNASEFDEENPHSSETSSKKSEQKKSISVSGIVSNWVSSLFPKKS
jgi:Fe-S-cluster-containing dehydrogenase component